MYASGTERSLMACNRWCTPAIACVCKLDCLVLFVQQVTLPKANQVTGPSLQVTLLRCSQATCCPVQGMVPSASLFVSPSLASSPIGVLFFCLQTLRPQQTALSSQLPGHQALSPHESEKERKRDREIGGGHRGTQRGRKGNT